MTAKDEAGPEAMSTAPKAAAPAMMAEQGSAASINTGQGQKKERRFTTYSRDFIDFVRSVDHFPYVADAVRQNTIKSQYAQLRTQMTEGEVISLIGKPDYTQDSAKLDPPYNREGTQWTYVLSERNARFLDPRNDSYLQIFLDIHGRAYWFLPTNISGLSEVGGPGR
jgi:hypothetical protein